MGRQPSRFRLRAGVRASFVRASSISIMRWSEPTATCRPRLSELGLRRFVGRNDRGAEPLGPLCLRPAARERARLIQEKAKGAPNGAANGADGAAVVESVHRDIRRLGGVRPPREFVFMDRAAVGLGSVFMHLKAEINWHRLFHELIEDFDEAALAARQAAALKAAGVPATVEPEVRRPARKRVAPPRSR